MSDPSVDQLFSSFLSNLYQQQDQNVSPTEFGFLGDDPHATYNDGMDQQAQLLPNAYQGMNQDMSQIPVNGADELIGPESHDLAPQGAGFRPPLPVSGNMGGFSFGNSYPTYNGPQAEKM